MFCLHPDDVNHSLTQILTQTAEKGQTSHVNLFYKVFDHTAIHIGMGIGFALNSSMGYYQMAISVDKPY